MKERISQLKEEVKKQEELNIALYKSIPLPTKEDPNNEKAEPILKQWRDGSIRIKALIREMNEIESNLRKQEESKAQKVFVNSWGEATAREITTVGYTNYQKRLNKQVLSFMGNR